MNELYEEDVFFKNKKHSNPDERLVEFAFRFLFPDKVTDFDFYKHFSNYVYEQFRTLGCAVIWNRDNSRFSSLIGNKEVIIKERIVLVSPDFRLRPRSAFSL